MNGRYRFFMLLAVIGISIVAGMLLGRKLDSPRSHSALQLASPASVPVAGGGAKAPVASPGAGFAGIVESTLPAVVGVTNTAVAKPGSKDDPHRELRKNPLFRKFFEMPEGETPPETERIGFGSGFIISPDGYILTNHHVVEGALRLVVTLGAGERFEAKVVGSDPGIDLALLKIDPKGKKLPTLSLGDSAALRVGEWVIAIGNPLGDQDLQQTVTVGVVSAKGRRVLLPSSDAGLADFIQTDAAINRGNSGGPLLDAAGKVVGINTAIFRGNLTEGIGFALPINQARQSVEQILETGEVRRGYLGISLNPEAINETSREYYGLPDRNGVIVQRVVPGGPAAGRIRPGDVIRKVNAEAVRDNQDLIGKVASHRPGERVRLELFRGGKLVKTSVTLGDRDQGLAGIASGSGRRMEKPGKSPAPRKATGFGIRVEDLTPESRRRYGIGAAYKGVLVVEVAPASAASEAGLARGQLITAVNDHPVTDVGAWNEIVRGLRPGEPAKLDTMAGFGDGEPATTFVFLRVPEK